MERKGECIVSQKDGETFVSDGFLLALFENLEQRQDQHELQRHLSKVTPCDSLDAGAQRENKKQHKTFAKCANFSELRAEYYRYFFGLTEKQRQNVDKVARVLSKRYVATLAWNIKYYLTGQMCGQKNTYNYQYEHSPLLTDIV